MPIFIDCHMASGITRERLETFGNFSEGRNGVRPLEIFYNEAENVAYCILEAQNIEAVSEYHRREGLTCKFVTEVDEIKTERIRVSEKLQILGELSSMVSHDLRTPVSIIKNSIDIINLKFKGEMPKEMEDYLQKMDRAATSIITMVEDIVNFARTTPLRIQNQRLLPVIRRSIESVQIPDNIKLTIQQNHVAFDFDAGKLEVLFNNLITNAIHAIGSTDGEVSVTFGERDEDHVEIRVQDSGPGIPETVLPMIFEPLFTTKQHGTGLGLPSCKNIVEQHGGTIFATNNPTTITVVFPKRQKEGTPESLGVKIK
ncbi:MAG: DUF4242 domain-containing protein [Thaumarchaeota archaeon]|nr:DUF4242 domain-containing protein [Nitrososphaerota archaeon]